MHYRTFTVNTIPGKRLAAIEHLKKLAALYRDTHQVPTEVLSNGTGAVYRSHVSSKYQSMAQMEEVEEKFLTSPAFQEWFAGSVGLLAWQDATTNIFIVHD